MPKKIIIQLPTWLGDAVMATPAITNIIKHFKDSQITLVGSYISTQALKNFPNITNIVLDNSKDSFIRLWGIYKLSQKLTNYDIAFSFRRSTSSKILFWLLDAKQKFQYKRATNKQLHQVIYYNNFINRSLQTSYKPSDLKLYYNAKKFSDKTVGINAGATYGSAKRWDSKKFAQVASMLSDKYNIILFGGPNEIDIVNEIEQNLISLNITNYKNLAGKTTIDELISYIGGLDLFITNDSGPMHIAAAYHIPTVAIFGPTNHIQTSQWQNPKSKIVKIDIDCSPCMQRTCPKIHHKCLKDIDAKMVFDAAINLISSY